MTPVSGQMDLTGSQNRAQHQSSFSNHRDFIGIFPYTHVRIYMRYLAYRTFTMGIVNMGQLDERNRFNASI